MVDTDTLRPRKDNRNQHGQDQIERLAEVYRYQGFRNPIIVSTLSGEVVCGTGRLLAAKRAGLKKVPVLYQDYDSIEQEYAHHVADNGLNLWSRLDFSGINDDLENLGPDFNLDMLGIKDFTLDFESEFSPDSEDDEEKKDKLCPHCGNKL